jgi:hypothetical protein
MYNLACPNAMCQEIMECIRSNSVYSGLDSDSQSRSADLNVLGRGIRKVHTRK